MATKMRSLVKPDGVYTNLRHIIKSLQEDLEIEPNEQIRDFIKCQIKSYEKYEEGILNQYYYER